jgi:hypothetical protein
MGNDNNNCGLSNNEGCLDQMGVPAPLEIKISSAYDEATKSGTLTVIVTLDGDITPSNGMLNKITVLLYERDVGRDKIVFSQLARKQLIFADFTPTQPGQQAAFTAPFALDPSWVEDNVGAVAFVQNYLGNPDDAPKDLMAYDIYNSGFLQNVNASTPPPSGHTRPVTPP